MAKLSANAAIAQPVERILGKDEVASSNLASSSKKTSRPIRDGCFFISLLQIFTGEASIPPCRFSAGGFACNPKS